MKVFAVILLVAVFIFGVAGCTPAVQNATTAPAAKISATPAPATAARTPALVTSAPATAAPAPSAEKDYSQIGFDLMAAESIGKVKLNMTESELLAALGQPDGESDPELWGADGLHHSDWTYESLGLVVNMTESTNPESEFTVYSVNANAPCDQATKRGVKIGDTKDAVLTAYRDEIENPGSSDTAIVAGTVFGGVQFSIKDGLVSGIFIGASAE